MQVAEVSVVCLCQENIFKEEEVILFPVKPFFLRGFLDLALFSVSYSLWPRFDNNYLFLYQDFLCFLD
jgi:hypothetical protein